MQARAMILTGLILGPLLGTLMGIAANPTMLPPPEPPWRKARPEPAYAPPSPPEYLADLGSQDVGPNWYLDRMPTWKRRALAREMAAYTALAYAPLPELPAAEPEPAAEPNPAPAVEDVPQDASSPAPVAPPTAPTIAPTIALGEPVL